MNVLGVDPFWLTTSAKIAGALTSFAVINKYVFKPFRKNVLLKAKVFYEKVNTIEAEMKPNGGGSLRDAIDRIHAITLRLDQRQRNFFQFDPNGIFEMDATGQIIWVNRAYLDIIHRHPEDILGFGWRSCISEHDRHRVITEWEYAVKDKRDFVVKMGLLSMEGEEVPVEARALRMLDDKGNLIGHLGFMSRLDQPPIGCRWCRSFDELVQEGVARRENATVSGGHQSQHHSLPPLVPRPKKAG